MRGLNKHSVRNICIRINAASEIPPKREVADFIEIMPISTYVHMHYEVGGGSCSLFY